MDNTYAEVGTEVVLGKHVCRSRGEHWRSEKDQYVGKRTTITYVTGLDFSGCLCCAVSCDNSRWDWRVESMILASDVPLLTPEQKAKMRIQDG